MWVALVSACYGALAGFFLGGLAMIVTRRGDR
jgi:hypothetical protein